MVTDKRIEAIGRKGVVEPHHDVQQMRHINHLG